MLKNAKRLKNAVVSQQFFQLQSCRAFSEDLQSYASQDPGIEAPSSLPLSQLCKNTLCSNWRAQLSTINAGSDKKDAKSLYATLVNYVMLDGKPMIWIPKEDAHCVNLLIDDRGSLLTGHTDPIPLISLLKSLGKASPRTIIFGDFVSIDKTETGYVKGKIAKQVASSKDILDRAGPTLQEFLEHSGQLRDERTRMLEFLASEANDMTAFRLYGRASQYVDLAGVRHSVSVSDIVGAAVDPLAPLHIALLEGVNQSETKRRALVLFCAAHLQLQVEDAVLFSADKWGFNILGQPLSEDGSVTGWREFRFTFNREVRTVEGFCVVLNEMEREVLESAS